MNSDRLWNEIRTQMPLEQTSDAFTDRVMRAVLSEISRERDDRIPTAPPNAKRIPPGNIQAELMNWLVASAATFLFVAAGLWAKLMTFREGAFGWTVREQVTQTVKTGIEWFAEVANWI